MHILAPRIGENTTTTGTGPYVVTGVFAPDHQPFYLRCQVNDFFYGYVEAVDSNGNPTGDWEEGRYTITAINTIARSEVTASSNDDVAVNWGEGTKRVRMGLTSRLMRTLITGTQLQNLGIDPPEPVPAPTSQVRPYIVDGTLASSFFGPLVFSDEFNGTTLNSAKWTPYQPHWQIPVENPGPHFDVADGQLSVWLNDTLTGQVYNNDNHGVINTDGKFHFKYVFIEVEATLGYGGGHWPGIWTYSTVHDDQWHEEIDIMEAYPGGNNANGGQTWGNDQARPIDFAATVWAQNGANQQYVAGDYRMQYVPGFAAEDLSAGPQKYAVLWEPDGITFYFKGRKMGAKIMVSADLNDFHFMNLQEWAGSSSGATDPATLGKAFGSRYNYCRIWSLASGATQTAGPIAGTSTAVDPASGTTSSSPGGGSGVPGSGTTATRVEFYGDSTVRGYKSGVGGTVATTMPQQFATNFPGVTVVNNGINSVTSQNILEGSGPQGALGGWLDVMAASTASHVLCMVGINDAALPMDEGTFKYYQVRICQQARAAGKHFTFLTNNPTSTMNTGDFAQWTRDVGATEQADVIDVYQFCNTYMANNNLSITQAFPDGIHPSDELYIAIGNFVAQQFDIIT